MMIENMADVPPLQLKRGEERRISAGHVWVFSNEIDTAQTPLTAFAPGALCRVISSRQKFLGYAYVNPHSLICARLLSRDPQIRLDRALFVRRLQAALSLRQTLFQHPYYRLVHGESDTLPGLVLDRFGDIVVGQIGTAGMEALKAEIEAAVAEVMNPKALLWKNDSGVRELEALPRYVALGFGDLPSELWVEEGGVRFQIPTEGGQKTGWFFDQATNRLSLRKYVSGKRVLDVFSYLGAWGLGALRAGAAEVTCADSSAAALELLQLNAAANNLQPAVIRGDAFAVLEQLRAEQRKFDIVVVDPPAFIKRKKDLPKGEAAYKRLNQLAMQVLERDGLLVSCSCSYHLSTEGLMQAVQHGARHLQRFVQILEIGNQAPDHPIHPAIAETRYLQALFCRVGVE